MQNLKKSYVLPVMAFTLSPPMIVGDYCEHYHTTILPELVRFFRRCSKRYIVYPEFSDTCRLHFHGLLYVHDKTAMIKGLPRLQRLGYIKMDKIKTYKDHLNWIVYISKERAHLDALKITEPIYPRKPIRSKKTLDSLKIETNLTRYLVPIDTPGFIPEKRSVAEKESFEASEAPMGNLAPTNLRAGPGRDKPLKRF